MTTSRTARWVVVCAVVGLVGCGADVAEEAGSSERASDAFAMFGPEARPLFQDRFSETGSWGIYQMPDGQLAAAVTGGIGLDDSSAVADILALGDLGAVYRAMHPEATTIPGELSELNQRVARLQAAAPEQVLEAGPLVSGLEDKSEAAFMASVCVTHWQGSTMKYVPNNCKYVTNHHATCSYYLTYDSADWVFGWNESPSGANVFIYEAFPSSVHVQPEGYLSPWTWGFFFWYGSTIVDRLPCIDLHAGLGSLGIAHHDLQYVIR